MKTIVSIILLLAAVAASAAPSTSTSLNAEQRATLVEAFRFEATHAKLFAAFFPASGEYMRGRAIAYAAAADVLESYQAAPKVLAKYNCEAYTDPQTHEQSPAQWVLIVEKDGKAERVNVSKAEWAAAKAAARPALR